MSRTNDITTVLPAKTGTDLCPKNRAISTLADGMIGIFDANTGLSIDQTTSAADLGKIREIFFALGIGAPVNSMIPKVRKSTGDVIQTRKINTYTYQTVSASRPKIVKIDPGTNANCEQDFLLKVEFKNGELYRTQGFNQFAKTYGITTGACDNCFTCFSGDPNEVVKLMVASINADGEDLITAAAYSKQEIAVGDVTGLSGDLNAGDPISDADLMVLVAFNKTVDTVAERYYSYFTITSSATGLAKYSSINLSYFYMRQTDIIVSTLDGFAFDATTSITQEIVNEEGSGYDLQNQEYHAMGSGENGPYRVSYTTCIAKDTVEYLVDKTAQYNVINLGYANSFMGETREYDFHGNRTIIAIPIADTTLRSAIITVLDGIVAPLGFNPLTDDVSATSDSGTAVEGIPATTLVDGVSD